LYHENIGVTEHGYWVEAKDLRAGDVFLGANGELSILVSTERVEFPEGITVYNFTVDGNHDYFVIAETDNFGQTCILVHNANYTQTSRTHVFSHGHAANSPATPDKSRFFPTEGGQKFTDEIINHPNVQKIIQKNGRIKYWVDDLGRNIGRNQSGNVVRGGEVIVEGRHNLRSNFEFDEVVTQYPR
jgi:hypothetical protein